MTDRARRLRLIAIVAIAAPILLYGAKWLHQRLTHVYTDDAHVAGNMIALSPRVAGTITRADLVQGDRVKKDQILVELDVRAAELELETLNARYAALEAELVELDQRIELAEGQGRSGLEQAEARLAALRAAKAASAVELEQLTAEHRRLVPMAKDGLVSPQTADAALFAMQTAQRKHQQAEAELRRAAAALEEARLELMQPALLRQRKDILAARMRELDADRRRQALTVDDHYIRSPIDGVIDKVFVEPGEYAGPGRMLVMLHAPEQIWIEARVKETALAPLRIGQPVRLKVDAFPDHPYRGRLERIVSAASSQFSLIPSPNPSGNFTKVTQRIPLRIAVENPDARLSPGMMVEAFIDIRD